MCEVCKWIEENEATKKRVKLLIPMKYFSGYESPDFKIKYCGKCGRRLGKNGGKE